MFRVLKVSGSKSQSTTELFITAEFHTTDGKEDGFGLAASDGTDTWTAIVKEEAFDKLVTSSRLGLDVFKGHTAAAFAPVNDAEAGDAKYVVDVSLSAKRDQMDMKWKLRQSGISKIIGHAQLSKSSNPEDINDRILSAAISHIAVGEYRCEKLQNQIGQTDEAISKLKEIAEKPDFKEAILERTVEILNDAKRRNRELGGSTEGFQQAWELATQPTTSAMDAD